MATILKVEDLHVHYAVRNGGVVEALRGITFDICSGEIVGVLGESGSGKTTMAKVLAGSLSKTARVTQGGIHFGDASAESTAGSEPTRRGNVVLISQEPGIALNPVLRVGDQIVEVLRAHNRWSMAKCRDEARGLLRCVRLDDDPKLYDAYPHQISGGQQQRVVIAQALACRPALLIADEPTAALDESSRTGILELLKAVVLERGMSLVLITHTPGILKAYAQRILVMYGGRAVEFGLVDEVFRNPLHPYTQALLQCSNSLLTRAETVAGSRFPSIKGDAPNLELPFSGCSFAPRCEGRLNICCENSPIDYRVAAQRSVQCFLYAE